MNRHAHARAGAGISGRPSSQASVSATQPGSARSASAAGSSVRIDQVRAASSRGSPAAALVQSITAVTSPASSTSTL